MRILLGVTGGIAAYKALELTRLYIKSGFEIQVVMTAGAKEFIQPLSFQALSGKPVRDSLFDANQEAGMGHIELARWADIIVIAPASAETLARLCHGRADDLLSTLILASDRPVLVAPAMNRLMWANAATQANVELLQSRGLHIMTPDSGEQACGEVGEGRLPEPEQILNASQAVLEEVKANAQRQQQLKNYWQGRRLLITAGPTHEAIDPVRFIGNRSSGKMGFAIAEAAAKAGAKVTLIAGSVSLKSSPNIERIDVQSAEQMFKAVQQNYQQQDCFIGAAAVADYRIAEPATEKMKKQAGVEELTLKLVKNPDIIQWVAAQVDKPFVVGFAAETNNVIDYAKDKLERKKLDMICANQVGENLGFESKDNQLTFITKDKLVENPLSDKKDQALALLGFIAENN